MPRIKSNKDIPDIQSTTTGFPKKNIKKVGVRNVKVPLHILRKDSTINSSSGDISMYTDLNPTVKGANMSRYRMLIESYLIGKDLNLKELIREMLPATRDKLGANNSYIKIKFDYFVVKQAPVSKEKCYMEYKCVLEGKLLTDKNSSPKERYYLTVQVPYTSCCPCSKEISDHGAHNQRSYADVKVELKTDQIMWIEDVIELVEKNASSPIINVLKRVDESYQTELMYENPRFVEDMVRLIAEELDKYLDKKILDYVVVVNHEESIHTHNAVAVISAGRELQ